MLAATQDYHIHTHANYGVCQEADRFKMSPVNDNNASVESFKRLDLDYLQVGSRGIQCTREFGLVSAVCRRNSAAEQ